MRANPAGGSELQIHRARPLLGAIQSQGFGVLGQAHVFYFWKLSGRRLLGVQNRGGEDLKQEGPHDALHFTRNDLRYNESVPGPLIPTPFDHLGRRRFSFYPAIVGIEHNEWTLRRITSTEVQVVNTKSSEEIWIPRRFLGEVSATEDPFIIAGLVQELEYQAGAIAPHRRSVIQMPHAVNGPAAPAFRFGPQIERTGPAPVIGIRVETGPSSRMGKRLLTWIVAGILAAITAAEALIIFGSHRATQRRTLPAQPHPDSGFGNRHVPLTSGDVDPQQH